jgi:hypothetical protein
MNWNKLAERLRRDLARNKAKSSVLGVLCLVALYYWFPLVAKLWSKPDTANKKSDAAATATEDPVEASAPTAPPQVDFVWQDFLVWSKNDPRMSAMTLPSGIRNPFQSVATEAVAQANGDASETAEASASAASPRATPAELGMQLKGTMVGRRGSTANISGIAYQLGTRVPAGSPEQAASPEAAGMEFMLVEIGDRHVLLERDGNLFRLEMEQGAETTSGRIVIRPAGGER